MDSESDKLPLLESIMDFLPDFSSFSVTPPMAFGLMLLVGVLGGYLAHRISWLPSITGFMAVGFLAGPDGIGILNSEVLAGARFFVNVALALILYRLGLSLDLKLLMRSPGLLLVSLFESFATFGTVIFILVRMGIAPFLSALIASIVISSSPAVLLHVANEMGAAGEVTESSKTLIALNNLISFLLFFTLLPFLYYSTGNGWATVLLQPLYGFLGSLVLGGIAGYCLHEAARITHSASQYKLAIIIGVLMLAIGAAEQLRLSGLFIPLVVGAFVKSMEKKMIISEIAFGEGFELFFVILFVSAGASLHVKEVIVIAPAVFSVVLVRSLVKVLSVGLAQKVLHKPLRSGLAGGMLLVPMAGLAIGLVQTTNAMFPEFAPPVAAIVLGAVAVLETAGPPIASWAFRIAGEATGSGRVKREEGSAS